MRTLACLPLALLAPLLSAAAAGGATIDVAHVVVEQRHETLEGVEATLVTDEGTASDIELRVAQDTFALRDRGSAIVAGRNCRAAADGWVECTMPRPDLDLGFVIHLGDLDDALRATGAARRTDLFVAGGDGADRLVADAAIESSLWGGAGNDLLQGGPLDDSLVGNKGADVLRGGAGDDALNGLWEDEASAAVPDEADDIDGGPGAHDVVTYVATRRPVTVDLQRGVGGTPKAWDTLRGIEGAVGGRRPSSLRGSDAADAIHGMAHGDSIVGRGGDDRLYARGLGGGATVAGGAGDDHIVFEYGTTVDAGAGDDTVDGYDPKSAVVCGPGTDTLLWQRGWAAFLPWSRLDCERFETPYAILRTLRVQPPRLSFRVRATVARRRLCAVRALVRSGQRDHPPGRELARTTLRLSDRRARTLELVAHGRLPRTVTVELHPQRCDRRGVPRTTETMRITRIPIELPAGR